MKNKTIKVNYLARVEGEGALFLKIKNNEVKDIKLKIFEPPRFFEAFLRGRYYYEAPDITARICGICPIAYQMTSVHALENAFDIKIPDDIRCLRRLIYCGEWIESHTLHLFMLHAPDFLGYDDIVQMSKDYPEIVKNALKLKKIGNDLMNLVGGREIHPINIKVGGFYKVPSKKDLLTLYDNLIWAKEEAINAIKFVANFNFPEFYQDYECVSLVHPDEYPINEGKIQSNKGLDLLPDQYDFYFREEQVEHSNALHSRIRERENYLVGPIARYNLNFNKLTPLCKEIAEEVGLAKECFNPFKSIIVRGIEILYSCEEAIRLIDNYIIPQNPCIKIEPFESTGYACTEAPRGMIYHRYSINSEGIITDAKIVPPTSQNQKTIENDLKNFVPTIINLSEKELTMKCEQAIRNYDPCISCATHFLKLNIQRE